MLNSFLIRLRSHSVITDVDEPSDTFKISSVNSFREERPQHGCVPRKISPSCSG